MAWFLVGKWVYWACMSINDIMNAYDMVLWHGLVMIPWTWTMIAVIEDNGIALGFYSTKCRC
mgnify:CR=1 FL=1